MAGRVSEAFVLRTYPFREADLVVSMLTRDRGKLRGTARAGRKPKNLFGSGLERLSLVHMHYSQRENRDLVTLIRCDLIQSQFAVAAEYGASVALDLFAEAAEEMLPPDEPDERFFRLLIAVTDHIRADPVVHLWPALTYFAFWAVQLAGLMPELVIQPESQEIAAEMARTPVAGMAARSWTKQTAEDLRRLLIRQMENHTERRFKTVPLLEAL